MISLNRLKVLYKRYEGYLIPLALFFGFATDILTFRLIEFTTSMLFLLGHLLFAGLNIVVINYFEDKLPQKKITSFWKLFAPLFLQFSFGNLFSGFLIFYSRSGSFFASWPFLLMVAALLIGNEVARRYDVGPAIQLGAYFFALFAYFNLALPYIFKRLNLVMFLISGILSFVLISVFIHFLSKYAKRVKKENGFLIKTIVGFFVLMNFLYFSNLIPPIPLTLKDVGVYHSIERINDSYEVTAEECQNWDRCLFTREKRHITVDRQPIYFYSATYAPPEMDMRVVHEWQKYDRDENGWITQARIPFDITGGREIGFRWYSYYNADPGLWRVNVQTERGQTIGRKSFHIVQDGEVSKTIEIK